MAKSDSGSFDPTKYASVAERIRLFWESFPGGRIRTRLVSRTEHDVVFEARVYRSADDQQPAATGWAAEREGDGDVNAVACLENTETSAVGRALANLGFTAARERPSVEEMQKAARARARRHLVGQPDSRQQRADLVSDALTLLPVAEGHGLRPQRADAIRARLLAETTPASAAEGIGRVLRRWIHTQVQREVQGLARVPRS
jgi:hypothetical protein